MRSQMSASLSDFRPADDLLAASNALQRRLRADLHRHPDAADHRLAVLVDVVIVVQDVGLRAGTSERR